jgi:ABC-type microcin C transport system permease subunit YejB
VFKLSAGNYVGAAFLAWLAIPAIVSERWGVAIAWIALNLAVMFLVTVTFANRTLNYWQALSVIAGSLMTGCANISVLLAVPAVLCAYLISIGLAIERLAVGRERALEQWFSVVAWIARHPVPRLPQK